jgi:hypothetical protein
MEESPVAMAIVRVNRCRAPADHKPAKDAIAIIATPIRRVAVALLNAEGFVRVTKTMKVPRRIGNSLGSERRSLREPGLALGPRPAARQFPNGQVTQLLMAWVIQRRSRSRESGNSCGSNFRRRQVERIRKLRLHVGEERTGFPFERERVCRRGRPT